MGLITTAAIIAVIAIVIAAGLFVALHKTLSTTLTKQGAEALVVNDIKTQNPYANVTMISVSNSSLAANSWQMTLSVVYNGSKPCPTVLIEQFDYPATGLHPSNDTEASAYNSGNCKIYIYGSLPPFAPLYIASSYASRNMTILSYVSKFGYGNTFVTASNAGQLGIVSNQNETNITESNQGSEQWLIRYKATNANYSLTAVLDQSGTIIQTYNAST